MIERQIPSPSMLEAGVIPIPELATFALREGRRPRAIYTAHKWFARRLGTVVRALLVGAVSSPDDDFWEGYYGGADLRGFKLLDPFVGGGTSVVEASRLGASAVAVDIDPIACSITQLELTAARLPDLSEALMHLQGSVGQRLAQYHVYKDGEGRSYTILHHFWVQVVTCQGCGLDYDAHHNFQLAYDKKDQWAICSGCGAIERRLLRHKTMSCKTCGTLTTVQNGRVHYGKATCPYCGHQERLIDLGRRTASTPRWRQFAVEVLTKPDGGRPVPIVDRAFFQADEGIDTLYQQASKDLARRRCAESNVLPNLTISNDNRFDTRLIDYGYRWWTELFNDRQLLHLSVLSEAIDEYEEPVRTALAMAFSDHLTTNCMLTSYAAGWRRLTPLFSVRAFRHITRPIELNPWVDGTGRGSFPNTVRKLMRARDFARLPKEPLLTGGFKQVSAQDPEEPSIVQCGTSRDLTFLKDGSIDIVLTDPPYFDNIAYSELAEFFLPWLRFLNVIRHDGGLDQVMIESLNGRRGDPETLRSYTEGLSGVFSEVARVLKPAGILVFSYRHATPEAWLALAQALAPHAFQAVRVLPVPGEVGMGLHAHDGTGLWDAVFVFRRGVQAVRREGNLVLRPEQVDRARSQAFAWRSTLDHCSLNFSQVDETTILRAALVAEALMLSSETCGTAGTPLQDVLASMV
ncbi:DNA methyltransferase [Candidatus Kaiserbacteria bacterium]|nr:DNA methyltransferase [Candidatus Kaiserbacteria bacterium]